MKAPARRSTFNGTARLVHAIRYITRHRNERGHRPEGLAAARRRRPRGGPEPFPSTNRVGNPNTHRACASAIIRRGTRAGPGFRWHSWPPNLTAELLKAKVRYGQKRAGITDSTVPSLLERGGQHRDRERDDGTAAQISVAKLALRRIADADLA
ncbi:hypothetical protein [Herbidospora mongoliensis]|uniref:hypothetical protein n=1 Tax=Herbidospora mongoliensis TaxID=688067 RepID=UPI000AD25CAF|nr:hypothetical protein [Herbidospora mongoliensis]